MTTFNNDKNDFDLEVVLKHFQQCLDKDNNLILEEYISAYHELCRFFKLTGRLLSFVARDMESKIRAVEYHMYSNYGEFYHSLQSMVEYEIKQGTTHMKGFCPSGCRMFSRLHYILEFILAFMRRALVGDEDESMAKLAWDVYTGTLYKHHPWLSRKLAYFAVYALPSKKHLIDVMCKHDYDRVSNLLPQVIAMGQPIYYVSQQVLSKHDLLNIS